MKPLIILIAAFILALLGAKIFGNNWNFELAGNISMSVMLLFTAIGHFAFSKGMVMMMPGFIPFKSQLVFLTGIFEIAAAIGLLIPESQHITAIFLIVFFILILPVNINAAIKKVDFQKGTLDGNGINYLWFRVPLQIFFIAWVYWFSFR